MTQPMIRYNDAGTICMVEDADGFHVPTQEEMDTLPVGPDLTADEIDTLEG